MPKPIKLPEWASDETQVVEPNGSKKSTGWTQGERPPAETFNWYQWLVYKWVEFLDAWTTGHNHLDDGSDGSMPRLSPDNEIDWSRDVKPYTGAANGYKVVTIDDSNEHRVNHLGLGTTKSTDQADIVLANEWLIIGDSTGDENEAVKVFQLPAAGGPDVKVLGFTALDGGQLTGISTQAYKPVANDYFASADMRLSFPLDTSLYKSNLCKAVGHFHFNVNGSGNFEFNQGSTHEPSMFHNIDEASCAITSNQFKVALKTASYEPNNVQVSVQTTQSRKYMAMVGGIGAGYVNIWVFRWDSSSSDWVDVLPSNNVDSGELFQLIVTIH